LQQFSVKIFAKEQKKSTDTKNIKHFAVGNLLEGRYWVAVSTGYH